MEWPDVRAFGYILTEERAVLDATPAHIDLDAFNSCESLFTLSLGTTRERLGDWLPSTRVLMSSTSPGFFIERS